MIASNVTRTILTRQLQSSRLTTLVAVRIDVKNSSKYVKALKLRKPIILLEEFEGLVKDPKIWASLKPPDLPLPPASPVSPSRKKEEDYEPCIVCFEPGKKRCSRCKVTYYCGAECQKKDCDMGHKTDYASLIREQQKRDDKERLRKEKEEEEEQLRKKLAKEERVKRRELKNTARRKKAIGEKKERKDKATAREMRRLAIGYVSEVERAR